MTRRASRNDREGFARNDKGASLGMTGELRFFREGRVKKRGVVCLIGEWWFLCNENGSFCIY